MPSKASLMLALALSVPSTGQFDGSHEDATCDFGPVRCPKPPGGFWRRTARTVDFWSNFAQNGRNPILYTGPAHKFNSRLECCENLDGYDKAAFLASNNCTNSTDTGAAAALVALDDYRSLPATCDVAIRVEIKGEGTASGQFSAYRRRSSTRVEGRPRESASVQF